MYLTVNNRIKTKNKVKLNIVKELTKNSKDLYNKALFTVRQYFFNHKKYLKYTELYPKLKNTLEYKKLPSNCSQQTLKHVDNSFKSFFNLLKSNKYKGKVNIPKYLDKNGYYKVIFTKIHLKIVNNYIRLTLPKYIKEKYNTDYLYFKIPEYILGKEIKEIHLIPYRPYFKISFIYNKKGKNYDLDKYIGIDLGIDNLATVVGKGFNPVIIDGKYLKSRNRFFNKQISVLLSNITKGLNPKQWAKKINLKKLYEIQDKRKRYIKDYLHKASKSIIDLAIKTNTGNIVIGYNKNWKNRVNMGKVNNQKFLNIPHKQFVDYIKYKAELSGIKVFLVNEAYTSKTDSLALEPVKKHKKYLGKRIFRGLFQSSIGKLINADVNGALNILRKVAGDGFVKNLIGIGCLFQPSRMFFNYN